MKTKILTLLGLIIVTNIMWAQNTKEAKQKLATPNEERLAYDVGHYYLNLDVDISEKKINGYVDIDFTWINKRSIISFDLDDRFIIDSVLYNQTKVSFIRTKGSREVVVDLENNLSNAQSYQTLKVFYGGHPQEAVNAPWDGGFSWKSDKNNNPWVGVSCEGDGASIWWPNKDLLSDEPDSITFTCRYDDELFFVSNGDLVNDVIFDEYRETTWKTSLPINNYNVTLNIADYVLINKTYQRSDSTSMSLDYYVLSYNKEKAEEQFKIVEPMLDIFERSFGEYPFNQDGYALVETPYLGMEHQSAIAYGNQYKKGYLGRYPKHMDFDFIVIHETGHEWWGNSVSMKDRSDMWIHESFCTYSEAIFVEHFYGYEDMLDYLVYQKNFISNKGPIQGIPHRHESGAGTEIYYKGSWVLHTLRNILNDDKLWFKMIKDLALTYKIKEVNGVDVKNYISKYLQIDLDSFFALYFDSTDLPKIQFKEGKQFKVKMDKDYGFHFPFIYKGKIYKISQTWTKIKGVNIDDFKKELSKKYLFSFD